MKASLRVLSLNAIALIALANLSFAAWDHPHSDSANTGFVKVDTARAVTGSQFIPLGHIAPGANPVIGPDGTVYVGNIEGQLRAFHADGTPAWTRELNHGGIYAAPVVGADGSVYVVSVSHIDDHRGDVMRQRFDSWLHKFTSGGGWIFTRPFPERNPGTVLATTGATSAPPNIWRQYSEEVIMVPVHYPVQYSGGNLSLVAFSTGGAVLYDQLIKNIAGQVEGGGGSIWEGFIDFITCIPCSYTAPAGGPAQWPDPGLAIWQNPLGGTPWIVVSDGLHDTVGLTFSTTFGFYEYFRVKDAARNHSSPPVILSDGHSAIGTDDPAGDAEGRIVYGGPNGISLAPVGDFSGGVVAAPTRMRDGRLAVVEFNGRLKVLFGSSVVREVPLGGAVSMASAAASCTHLFVATIDALVTLDTSTMTEVARMTLTGGGLNSPVIGPAGHVYVIDANKLVVFPPPISRGTGAKGTACDQVVA